MAKLFCGPSKGLPGAAFPLPNSYVSGDADGEGIGSSFFILEIDRSHLCRPPGGLECGFVTRKSHSRFTRLGPVRDRRNPDGLPEGHPALHGKRKALLPDRVMITQEFHDTVTILGDGLHFT